MIKASELRPGVYIDTPAGIKQINGVVHGSQLAVVYFDRSTNDHIGSHMCKPIPLTEEWLLKFGFRKHEEGYFFTQVGNQLYLEYHDISNGVQVVPETWNDAQIYPWRQCLYVHELQNLYHTLTGEELQIKES